MVSVIEGFHCISPSTHHSLFSSSKGSDEIHATYVGSKPLPLASKLHCLVPNTMATRMVRKGWSYFWYADKLSPTQATKYLGLLAVSTWTNKFPLLGFHNTNIPCHPRTWQHTRYTETEKHTLLFFLSFLRMAKSTEAVRARRQGPTSVNSWVNFCCCSRRETPALASSRLPNGFSKTNSDSDWTLPDCCPSLKYFDTVLDTFT